MTSRPWPVSTVISLACLLAIGGCAIAHSSPRVTALAEPEADFGRYRSYAFADPTRLPAELRRYDFPDAELNTIKGFAREALQDRGFVPAPMDTADLLFHVAVGTRTRQSPSAASTAQSEALQARLASWEADTRNTTLVIDAVDRHTGKHVWHGRANLQAEAREDHVAADEVAAILDELPEAGPAIAAAPTPATPVQPPAPAAAAPVPPAPAPASDQGNWDEALPPVDTSGAVTLPDGSDPASAGGEDQQAPAAPSGPTPTPEEPPASDDAPAPEETPAPEQAQDPEPAEEPAPNTPPASVPVPNEFEDDF